MAFIGSVIGKICMEYSFIKLTIITLVLLVSCKNKETPVEILFWSNLNGNLENCGCGDHPKGGLDLAGSFINKRRSANPDLLFIDGGNFGNTYSYPAHNLRMEIVYSQLKPEILTPGFQDLVDRPNGFGYIGQVSGTRFICSNYEIKKNDFIPSLKKTINGQMVHIYSVMAPSLLQQAGKEILPAETDQFQIDYQKLANDDLLLVIFQGMEEDLDNFCKTYPAVDCILWSFAQSDRIQSGIKPFIIGGRSDGEYLLDLQIYREHLKAEVITIDQELSPDSRIRNLLDSTQILIKP
jgi:hypothetical protein